MLNRTEGNSYLPLSGALFTVLAIIATFVIGFDGPDFAGSPVAIVDRYTEDFESIAAGNVLHLLSAAPLLIFVSVLYSRARRAEGPGGAAAVAIVVGATAGTALMLAGAGIDAMAAIRVEDQGAVDPQVAVVAFDASSILYRAAAPIGWAVALLATARLGLGSGLLPRWLAIASGLLGVLLLIPQISYLGMVLFTLWPLAVGVALYRTQDEPVKGSAKARS